MSGGIDAGGDWAIGFQQDQIFRCFAFVSGHCWLIMEGLHEPIRLEAGDFLVLPHGRAFRMASHRAVPPVDIMTIVQTPLNGHIRTWQGGGSCLALSALFTFADAHAGILVEALPPIIHIRHPVHRETMRWYLHRMTEVLREAQPGRILLAEHLSQMMLIEVLRLYTSDSANGAIGWLSALAHPQLSAAMTAIHNNPAHRWTLHELARRAGMSRSVFALRFKQSVGVSAIEYLTRWRMLTAADRLVHSRDSVAAIALSLGYESESAFGSAFKRQMGCSPRQYAKSRAFEPAPQPAISA
jgi:AraC-like DNA-binding protein